MTGTEMLIAVMEEFQKGEPTCMLVIWLNEAGDISYSSNCGDILTVGMAEFIKERAIKRLNE